MAISNSRPRRGVCHSAMVWVLATQLVVHSGYGQAPSEQPGPKAIDVSVIGGEGAANNLGRQSNRVPAVKVQDEAAKPVAGASVVFTLPADGPSGEFRDGTRTYIASTDDKGTAEAPLRANMTPGRLAIHVNVSYRGLQARTNITQFNVAVAGVHAQSKSGKKWGVLLAAVGGAAAAGVFATRRSSGSGAGATATPPIGISTGSSSVGPPR